MKVIDSRTSIDGINQGRKCRNEQQLANGLPLTPQIVLAPNPRRVYAFITNLGAADYDIQLGTSDPSLGLGTDFIGSFRLYSHETAILEFDNVRGLCEWTGEVWSAGRPVGEDFLVAEVSLED